MTISMPELPSWQHYVSVNYLCTFGALSVAGGLVSFAVPSPVQFLFSFETGQVQPDPQVDLYDVSWNYSWFSQVTQEQQKIGPALDSICATIAAMLGITQHDVQKAVSVQRVWTVAPNQKGAAAPFQLGQGGSGPVMVAEVMPYPVRAAGTDAARAAEGASHLP